MITRIWHGKTKAVHAEIYLKYLQETGLKDYIETPGNISAKVLRQIDGDECHFYTVTEWDSIESIKKFAGEDFERARYYPEDEKYLLEFEETVNHYETFIYKSVNGQQMEEIDQKSENKTKNNSRLFVLGVPFNGDGTTPDSENPADNLRQAGLLECLQSGGTVIDLGDVEIPEFDGKRDMETQILNLPTWLKTSKSVAKTITKVDQDAFLLVLGGDCSILLGIFGGFALQGRRVGLVMLDGHTDYREPSTSETGEPADIELAVITGRGPQQVTEFFGKYPLVSEEDVIIYGYRDPDEIEKSIIRRFDRVEMAKMGMIDALTKGFAGFEKNTPIWLHLDVDVLDPSVMPVCYPEPNGLSIDEVTQFLDTCSKLANIIGLSVGCYHPKLDKTGNGAKSIVSLFSSLHISRNMILDSPEEL